MYNIIITGTDGFIGKKLQEELSNNFNVISMNRNNGYDMKLPLRIEIKKKNWFFYSYCFSN